MLRAASKGEAKLCVTSMDTSPKYRYPIEITFPAGLDREERKRIEDALTKTVQELGYETSWIPVL